MALCTLFQKGNKVDIQVMIDHYQEIFKNPKDVLDWIEHDLKHMGLGLEEFETELNKARKILGVQK